MARKVEKLLMPQINPFRSMQETADKLPAAGSLKTQCREGERQFLGICHVAPSDDIMASVFMVLTILKSWYKMLGKRF